MAKTTPQQVYEAIAASLRQFGYPDVKASMISDTHEAMKRGEKDLPHGIVGMFAEKQIKEARERGLLD